MLSGTKCYWELRNYKIDGSQGSTPTLKVFSNNWGIIFFKTGLPVYKQGFTFTYNKIGLNY